MYYVGIDLGGTYIKGGIVNKDGDIVIKKEVKTYVEEGYKKVISDIASLINDLIKDFSISIKDIFSIGIGIPGVANKDGMVYYSTNLHWTNISLGDMLRKEFDNIPVYVENDATVAALAEYVKGSMRNKDNAVMITLGTGVGGGIIINKKVFSGRGGLGSEIGHTIVGENFYNCNCGNNGCLETFCSATAVIKYAKYLMEENKNTSILEKIGDDLEKINAKIIIDCAKEKDDLANEVVDRFIKYLSIGIANIMNNLDPEIVSIGGGLSKAGDFILDKVRNEVPKYVLYKELKYGDIVIATLGNDAGIIGSAMLGI